MQIGNLVEAKFDIEIGGEAGAIIGKIDSGEIGIIINSRKPSKKKELHIQFNSGDIWWLTEDELELLSK